MTIVINYESDTKLHIPYKKIVEDMVVATLDYEGCPYEADVSVSIVDEERITEINTQFRGVMHATDVLSFPFHAFSSPSYFDELEEDGTSFHPESGELLLGDIILSSKHVIEQAKAYGHTRKRELAFLVVHSMLHLLGYDHMVDIDRELMELHQREILALKGIGR